MKLVVFGLTVSSSWGNGHATLWRGLMRALAGRGCEVVFFERNQSWYADNRDMLEPPGGRLVLYDHWSEVAGLAAREVREADAAMVTSYCPDAQVACDLIQEVARLAVYYDMDTPVTLARMRGGDTPDYVPAGLFAGFDLVLSYAGGAALDGLRALGARDARPLYGHVDPAVHFRVEADPRFTADLSYIGTYAADRQPALESLFVAPARARPERKFVLAGSGYPQDFPWTDNVYFVRHLPPPEHAAFYSSSRLTVNVTRADMAETGWTPSGRLFEAAACGCPVLSDSWPGLDAFFEPGREILVASTPEEALAAVDRSAEDLARIGEAARDRALSQHTSDHRAAELLAALQSVASRSAAVSEVA